MAGSSSLPHAPALLAEMSDPVSPRLTLASLLHWDSFNSKTVSCLNKVVNVVTYLNTAQLDCLYKHNSATCWSSPSPNINLDRLSDYILNSKIRTGCWTFITVRNNHIAFNGFVDPLSWRSIAAAKQRCVTEVLAKL